MEADELWIAAASCRAKPAGLFFPTEAAGVAAAQRICATCPVRRACLDYALRHNIAHGVWGGTSERARERLRTALRLAPVGQSRGLRAAARHAP